MRYSDINEILDIISEQPIAQYEVLDGNQLSKGYTIQRSVNKFTIIACDQENVSSLMEMLDFSMVEDCDIYSKTAHGWVCLENPLKIKPIREGVYFVIKPENDATDTSAFVELIAHLRSPEGCPWDRKQTHRSLRTNLLEETYEVLEAIDDGDYEHLREELGDLLLQVILHAQIAMEEKAFSYFNVVHDINTKIRNRHPHIFSDVNVDGVSAVMKNWEKIKEQERKRKPSVEESSILASIPKELPALSIAQKFQERAARVGFDWEDVSPVFEKVMEEIREVGEAKPGPELESELGDLLFAVVNLIRWSGFDAENALRAANKKFSRRFQYIEKRISESGQSLGDVSLSEMDALWNEAKRSES